MALNAATDQQYHLLDQEGTADDQMDQLQGDHDTPKQPQVQAGYSGKLQQGTSNDPPRTKNLRWFSSEEEENVYKSADDKHSSRSHSRSPGRKPHSPSKKSAPAPTQQNLHRGPPGGGAKGNGGDQGCTQPASSLPVPLTEHSDPGYLVKSYTIQK
ncbi:hypothetical protein MRX96_050519 [Rhipicephalus microplus]